ncbi:MAG: tRNA pseudouridine(38-40) synthase TruA [Gammaproteobacteria bacterium]|nr:tRNA pseudouridine(38-40) synthase TruA [Gammaproteobacteria bacterium]
MQHLALGIEYDGSSFHGFQRQQNVSSIQATLETALSKVADQPIRVVAAGRTDTAVHATGQVIGFVTNNERPVSAWIRGTNTYCPKAVKVRWAQEVDSSFHARYSATARRYVYVYYEADADSPLLAGLAVREVKLNDEAMHRAARSLLGEHDFSAFRGAGCQSQSPHRCVHNLSVHRAGSFVIVDIVANAFLLHMVRNINGSLIEIGTGRRPESWLGELLMCRDRRQGAKTAPPGGLYLVSVAYPGLSFPKPLLPGVLRALDGLDHL